MSVRAPCIHTGSRCVFLQVCFLCKRHWITVTAPDPGSGALHKATWAARDSGRGITGGGVRVGRHFGARWLVPCVWVSIPTPSYTCTHIWFNPSAVCVCARASVCACVGEHSYTLIHTHTHTHTLAHAYTNTYYVRAFGVCDLEQTRCCALC